MLTVFVSCYLTLLLKRFHSSEQDQRNAGEVNPVLCLRSKNFSLFYIYMCVCMCIPKKPTQFDNIKFLGM